MKKLSSFFLFDSEDSDTDDDEEEEEDVGGESDGDTQNQWSADSSNTTVGLSFLASVTEASLLQT